MSKAYREPLTAFEAAAVEESNRCLQQMVALGGIFLARNHRATEKVMFVLEKPLN